jgi:hypothetical protein
MNKIELEEVSAYSLYIDTDERHGHIKGYYHSFEAAKIDAKGAGWYGGDGRVDDCKVWTDVDGNLYKLQKCGKFVDIERAYQENMRARILEKLSQEEIAFLGLNKEEK